MKHNEAMDSKQSVTIIDTHEQYVRSASIVIDAPASVIFDLLAHPDRHGDFDGSGSVKGVEPSAQQSSTRLALHDRFTMSMKVMVPYRIQNEVVEFEEGRRIAWQHMGKHRWRYELESVDANTTIVTETFDARTARIPAVLKVMNAYNNNLKSIIATLPRLKDLAESTQQ
jgi:hypothetical protein